MRGETKSDYIFLLEVSKKSIQEIHIVEDLSNLGESMKVPFLPISPSLPSTPLPSPELPTVSMVDTTPVPFLQLLYICM